MVLFLSLVKHSSDSITMTAKLHNPGSTRLGYLIAEVDEVDSPIEKGPRRLHWRGRTGDTLSCVWEALLP